LISPKKVARPKNGRPRRKSNALRLAVFRASSSWAGWRIIAGKSVRRGFIGK
jgi:hypothetical protein